MIVSIVLLDEFKRNFKRLAKKYPSLKEDFKTFKNDLAINPLQGIDLGHNVRKVRMSIASKGKGKSGGSRILTYNATITETGDVKITLLTIYDKGEISNVTDAYIKWLVSLMK